MSELNGTVDAQSVSSENWSESNCLVVLKKHTPVRGRYTIYTLIMVSKDLTRTINQKKIVCSAKVPQ